MGGCSSCVKKCTELEIVSTCSSLNYNLLNQEKPSISSLNIGCFISVLKQFANIFKNDGVDDKHVY